MTQMPPSEPALTVEDKRWAAAPHISALACGFLLPGGAVFAPLAIWFLRRRADAFGVRHAKEAINFNLSLFLYTMGAAGALLVVMVVMALTGNLSEGGDWSPIGTVGMVLAGIMVLAWIVFSIKATVCALKGREYRYPFTLRIVR